MGWQPEVDDLELVSKIGMPERSRSIPREAGSELPEVVLLLERRLFLTESLPLRALDGEE
jgi:hypothetical protein